VHSSLNAVVHLKVKLRELVVLVSRSLLNITKRRSIYDVTDNEALDSLSLGIAFPVETHLKRKKMNVSEGLNFFNDVSSRQMDA
jgi:hypothetical protein